MFFSLSRCLPFGQESRISVVQPKKKLSRRSFGDSDVAKLRRIIKYADTAAGYAVVVGVDIEVEGRW